MITHEIRDNPEKIWLEPGCSPERCWCENVLDDCEEPGCGAKAVGYVREDIVDHATREAARIADENARLRAALEMFACDCKESGDFCASPQNCRNYIARAAIAVVLEEAAKVAENASFHFTQTTPSTVEVVDVRHTIAAAIRALVQK